MTDSFTINCEPQLGYYEGGYMGQKTMVKLAMIGVLTLVVSGCQKKKGSSFGQETEEEKEITAAMMVVILDDE